MDMRLACAAVALAALAMSPCLAQYSNPFCGYTKERNTVTVVLACAPGAGVINGVSFASYGTPTGTCGSFAHDPTCDSPNFLAFVEAVGAGLLCGVSGGLVWRGSESVV